MVKNRSVSGPVQDVSDQPDQVLCGSIHRRFTSYTPLFLLSFNSISSVLTTTIWAIAEGRF